MHFKKSYDIFVYTSCVAVQKEHMQSKKSDILFGKYEVISTLGTGSFGTVYLSRHTILECYRAIKIIPKSHCMTDSLLKEAQLLKSLHHSGIPCLYDIEEDEIAYYLIEEYVNGEPLNQFLLHQKQISQITFFKLAIQLCDIFQYLHTLHPSPLLYLDLKPEHIIVCGMQIKLIDFNVATFLSNLGNISHLLGNEAFSAPELMLGMPSLQSDIYSLGKILQYLSMHTETSISPNIHKLILKATSADPKKRLETVDVLLSALENEIKFIEQPQTRKNIAIIGSHSGSGATHIALSVTSTLNYMGHSCLYFEKESGNGLRTIFPFLSSIKEEDGMIFYRYFKGFPLYGPGVSISYDSAATFFVYDYGNTLPPDDLHFDIMIFVCSNGIWRWEDAFKKWETAKTLSSQNFIICNMGSKHTMHYFAKQFQQEVYHYPYDKNPFVIASDKVSFFSKIFQIKRRNSLFFHLRNRFIPKK